MILAISSLEIGVKECIFKLVPKSEWIVKNLPSPPILKILKEGKGEGEFPDVKQLEEGEPND